MTQDEKMEGVEVKALESLEIKNEATGEVELIFATLNVVDRDRDVIPAGAIAAGSKVKMSSYGHDIVLGGAAPVGKGVTFIEGDKAGARIKMFMSTDRGKEAFNVVKEMGPDQEWSFGFQVVEEATPTKEWAEKGARRILTKLDAFEVSPVLMGAGIGTRTLAAKHAKEAAEKAAEDAAEAQRVADEATAAAKAVEDTIRLEKEQKAAEEAETKRLEEAAWLKAFAAEAKAESDRIQRALLRNGQIDEHGNPIA